jgi:hypothetical protein
MSTPHEEERGHADESSTPVWPTYLRFGAMILTGMAVMYVVMFAGSWQWSDVRPSESRLFMTLTMGGAMGIVMLVWMLKMYRSVVGNVVVVATSLLLLAGGVALDRSQITVDDSAYLNGMIPHHSLAITRSERAQLEDVRVCELAVRISEAQRREILEMDWLLRDIAAHGAATTASEAAERAVPDFGGEAERSCGG